MTINPNLSSFLATLAPARQKIADRLLAYKWFQNTNFDLQKEVLSLPEDHEGFLCDLASRPDEIGELDVLKMTKIGHGHFLLLLVFEVRSNITNQVFTYEYASWKTGANPGARFLLFLENQGKITHFVVSKNHRFSSNEDTFEALGGLYLHVLGNKLENFSKKIEKEICFHLGIDDLKFKKIIPLGKAHPDFGMTNNVSDLFVATIDISDVPELKIKSGFRLTNKPVGFELKVIKIEEFKDYLGIIQDNYFLSAAARAMASKEIDLGV